MAQDTDEQHKIPRKDDPAARERWFRRGRQTRNGQHAAKMLHQAYQTKMKMRAARESKIRSLMATNTPLTADVAPSVGVWNNLGPRPIVDNPAAPNGYGPLAGRVTAVTVDQTDSTGNTVLAGGAYGGVWRSTNAAAADPATVEWTPLIDDQPTLAVGAIALQPGNSNVMLVGTGEPNYAGDSYYGVGILRSTDGGATWNTIASTTDGYSLYGAGVAQFAFSTKNTNLVMAATSFAVVWPVTSPGSSVAGTLLSTDAGASWKTIPFTNDNSNFYTATSSAVVYNSKQDKFYAVIPYEGVYVSNTTASAGITSFVRMKNQPGASGALSTTNCNITNYGSSTCPLLRGAMTVRPVSSTSDPDQMYIWFVADGTGDSGDDQGIWRSSTDTSGNVTWSSVPDSGITTCGDSYGCGTQQTFYNLYVSAVPNGTTTDLYAGAINIFKSNISCTTSSCTATAFKNLTHVYGCNTISAVHPDQHGIDFLHSNPNIMYFGDDGGVNRTLSSKTRLNTGACPSGNTQANAFDNLNNHIGALTQFMWGTNHPTDPTTLMGGSQDNGTMAVSSALPAGGDAGWWEVNAGDGGYDWIDPLTPTNWYSAYTGVSVQYCINTINCNTDTFLSIIEEDLDQGNVHQVDGDNSNFYTPYILDPAKPTQIIVGTCRVWRGGNSASAWPNNSTKNAISHQLGTTSDSNCSPATDPIQALAAGGPVNSNGTSSVIYAGTSYGAVYMTKNANTGVATWTDVTGSIDPDGFPIAGIALDPQDKTGKTAYVVVQGFTSSLVGHVWGTTNGGTSWTDETANLANTPVNDIAVDPQSHTLYVATDVGVFTAIPGGGWVEIGPVAAAGDLGYLPNAAVLHIAIYENGTDKRLRAWTHGRGVWETALVTPDMSISTDALNYSTQIGTSSTQSVKFSNLSSTSLTFGTPTLNGPLASEFTISSSTTCGSTLAAGASCSIAVTFSPGTNVSSGQAFLTVVTSSKTYGVVGVSLNATVLNYATDFSYDFGSNSTSQTVTAGQTATYTFDLDAIPIGAATFNPAVSLTCSLPSSATKTTCSFSNGSLSAPGSTTLTVTTTAPTTTSAQRATNAPTRRGMPAVLVFPVLGLVFLPIVSTRSQRKGILMYAVTLVIVASLLGLGSCGGGGGGTTTAQQTTVPGTPSGTYTVNITGTYGSNTPKTQSVTLVVK